MFCHRDAMLIALAKYLTIVNDERKTYGLKTNSKEKRRNGRDDTPFEILLVQKIRLLKPYKIRDYEGNLLNLP